LFCDVAGRVHDAGGDGISDGSGHSEPHTEDLQEPAAMSRVWGTGDGCSFRRVGQVWVSKIGETQPS
jgi:hypothetical protein